MNRTAMLCAGIALIAMAGGNGFAQERGAGPRRQRNELPDAEVKFSDTVTTGFVFLNGAFLQNPYTIQATQASVLINGQELDVDYNSTPLLTLVEDDEASMTEVEQGRRRGPASGFRGARRFGFRAAHRPNPHVRFARSLAESLHSDAIVIVSEADRFAGFVPHTIDCEFCRMLVADSPAPADLETVEAGLAAMGFTPEIRNWLRAFEPPESVRERLKSRYQLAEAAERTHFAQVAARERLETFSYPLTLAGMFLGVVTLGHALRWMGAGPGGMTEQRTDRPVQIAVLLMAGMAAIDLAWTILAGQAGAMREINPVAAGLIHSPIQLAVFKVAATSTGCGILYIWRQRHRIQVATWWMCLICALVTFRWVVFDSMIN